MIDLHLYLTFVLAVTVLMLIPGPNVALIVANSVAYGTRQGLLTVAGTASAMLVQLALTALGMTAALTALAGWIEWVRWAGVAYLLWLGVRQWRAPPTDLSLTRAQPRASGQIYLRGVVVSATNPKTLIFYGAFFPQFVTANADRGAARYPVGELPRLGAGDRQRLGAAGRAGVRAAGAARAVAQPAVRRPADRRRRRAGAGPPALTCLFS